MKKINNSTIYKLTFFCTAVVIVAIAAFVIETVFGYGYSMDPTIKHESVIFVTKKYSKIDKSVYCMYDPQSAASIVKRIVALPGDRVEIKNGKLYINGVEDTSTFSKNADYSYGDGTDIIVPEDEYFVLGDNRDISVDSRYFGTVPKGCIKEKVLFALY